MEQAAAGLKELKAKYLRMFYALFFTGMLARVFTAGESPAMAALFGLAALCLTVWFMVLTYKFARAVQFSVPGTIGLMLVSMLTFVNLIVILVLLRRYTKITGTAINFFMFDVAAAQ